MGLRLKELETFDTTTNENLKVKAGIESRAIRLIEFQKQVCVQIYIPHISFYSYLRSEHLLCRVALVGPMIEVSNS